ncbi:MAG: hypothetical protein ACXW00_08645 [Methylobacter sp.]
MPYSFDALQQSGPGVETRFQLAMKRRILCGFFMRVIQCGGLPCILLWRAYLGSVRRWPWLHLCAVFPPHLSPSPMSW